MPVNCSICRWELADYDKMTSLHCFSSGESVLFLAWQTNDSKCSLGIPRRCRQDVPHFGLKYL